MMGQLVTDKEVDEERRHDGDCQGDDSKPHGKVFTFYIHVVYISNYFSFRVVFSLFHHFLLASSTFHSFNFLASADEQGDIAQQQQPFQRTLSSGRNIKLRG